MSRPIYLAVGSLNREAPYFQGARGEGMTIFSLDEATLEVAHVATTPTIDNPTFLTIDPRSGVIYANSEVFGWHEGTVSAFRFSAAAGTLDYLNKQPTLGSIAAHNLVTRDGRFVLVANYGMGEGGPDRSVSVFPIRADGGLEPATASVRIEGKLGPDTDRQERPHAHMVSEVPGGGTFLVSDLGLDLVLQYRMGGGGLELVSTLSLPPGSGPRHIAQHGNGRFLYVSNELNSSVSAIAREGEALTVLQTLSSLAAPADSHGADIHLSPDGRFLYSSNRGDDSIAIFSVDQETGHLVLLDVISSGGATPRNFTLTPSGNHMLVANQNGDSIVIFERDAETGMLTNSGRNIDIGTPVCVRPFVV